MVSPLHGSSARQADVDVLPSGPGARPCTTRWAGWAGIICVPQVRKEVWEVGRPAAGRWQRGHRQACLVGAWRGSSSSQAYVGVQAGIFPVPPNSYTRSVPRGVMAPHRRPARKGPGWST